jgi:hypothetical protein
VDYPTAFDYSHAKVSYRNWPLKWLDVNLARVEDRDGGPGSGWSSTGARVYPGEEGQVKKGFSFSVEPGQYDVWLSLLDGPGELVRLNDIEVPKNGTADVGVIDLRGRLAVYSVTVRDHSGRLRRDVQLEVTDGSLGGYLSTRWEFARRHVDPQPKPDISGILVVSRNPEVKVRVWAPPAKGNQRYMPILEQELSIQPRRTQGHLEVVLEAPTGN